MTEIRCAADIPESERFIGIDPLWPNDSRARVAYSSNPRMAYPGGSLFGNEGPGIQPLRHKAVDFILVRPEIAEALEQIYLDTVDTVPASGEAGLGDAEGRTDDIDPVNVELALDGLDWLKKNLAENAALRHRAVESKRNLSSGANGNKSGNSGKEDDSAEQDAAAREAERRRQADMAAREAHRAEVNAQLTAVVGRVKQSSPELDASGLFRLAETLHSSESRKGVHISEYKGFPLTVSDQVLSFLDDPRRLINDMSVVRGASEFLQSTEHRHAYPIAAAYVDKIGEALTGTLNYGVYEDLSEETVDKWFSAIGSADDPEAAADILSGTGVLQRTLGRIVREDPVRFIDRLHMLAMRGLDPADETASAAALRIISDCLKADAMAACSLVQGSYFVEDISKSHVQEQAIDLVLTLMESGLKMEDYYSHDRYRLELKRKERVVLEKDLVPRLPNGRVDMKTWQARNSERAPIIQGAFVGKALTPEGKASTLYGRLREHRNSQRGFFRRHIIGR